MERYIRFGSSSRRRVWLLAVACLHGVVAPVMALAEGWSDSLQVHGFLSQGFVQTSANRWYGDSDEGSWDFREIGVNMSLRPAPRWQVAGQLLSRAAGDMDGGHVRLDYGLADYALISDDQMRSGVRLGRYKTPLGLYNETRDVAFTRPGIFLPQSIYLDRTRDLMLSSDGVEWYADSSLGGGDLSVELGIGYPQVDKNVEYSLLGRDFDGTMTNDYPALIGRILYDLDGGRIRLGVSGVALRVGFEPGPRDPPPPVLTKGSIGIDLYILSFQYNAEAWSFTSEYSQQFVDVDDLGAAFDSYREPTPEGYYFQAAYRVVPSVEVMARYDVKYYDGRDKSGQITSGLTGLAPHNYYAKDFTIGARWDLTSDFMLRAEYHRIEGTSWLSNRENDRRYTTEDWDLFSVLASYRF